MRFTEVMKFFRQFTVLVQRNLRLIWNDKLLLASLILQAPFMVFVIRLVVDPKYWHRYCSTSSGTRSFSKISLVSSTSK